MYKLRRQRVRVMVPPLLCIVCEVVAIPLLSRDWIVARTPRARLPNCLSTVQVHDVYLTITSTTNSVSRFERKTRQTVSNCWLWSVWYLVAVHAHACDREQLAVAAAGRKLATQQRNELIKMNAIPRGISPLGEWRYKIVHRLNRPQ